MKRENWIVRERDVRPAGNPGECFYCKQPLGEPHTSECRMRDRTVVMRAIIEYVTVVDEDEEPGFIDQLYNHSDTCKDLVFDEIKRVMDHSDYCMCDRIHVHYVREATPEDEDRDGIYVSDDDLPNLPVTVHEDADEPLEGLTFGPFEGKIAEQPVEASGSIVMAPGIYWIGDLCYVLRQEEHDELSELGDGKLTLASGKEMVRFWTQQGDGQFYDQWRNWYGVDSGSIGCVRHADIDRGDDGADLGNVFEFKRPFACRDSEGLLKFGNVTIDTRWPDGWNPAEIKRKKEEE